jgi:integrase/recombinase XerD
MAIVAIDTGLRNSDIRELRVDDLNFADLEIQVRDSKFGKSYEVPMTEMLAFDLRIWLRHHRGGYHTAATSEYLFPSQSSEKLKDNASLTAIIRRAAERAGIQDVIGRSEITETQKEGLGTEKNSREWHRVTVHTLRHTNQTLLKDAGVSLQDRQRVANHSSADTTRGYTHGRSKEFDPLRKKFVPPR